MNRAPIRFGVLWQKARTPLLLGALLALFYAPLADPQAVLATRDMVEYHLPMRTAFAALAGDGLPQWDPLAHGGQPLLSNPNYGAFYPLSWLVLLFPPAQAINLLVLLHAALAAWGAYRLAERLGARTGAAQLAALAYACGPTFLALLHTLTIALAMSFLPWMLKFALDILEPLEPMKPLAPLDPLATVDPPDRSQQSQQIRQSRAAIGASLSLAAIFLLGDPLIVAMSLLTLAAFVLGRPAARLRRLPHLLGPLGFGLGLAAVQVVPALARLAESPRGAGLEWNEATAWSLPWQRVAELVFPNFFGDTSRPELALYFGWGIHDRDYPYLLWIAVGLPLILAGLASWIRSDTPERKSFLLMALAGVFLAFGRHNPLYRWAWSHLPGIDKLRFPEKFLLLGLTAAIFSGALAWQRLLDQRQARDSAAGRGGTPLRHASAAELQAALAATLACLALGLAWIAFRTPQVVAAFAASHSGLPLVGDALTRALLFYRRESLWALGFALATLALFALAGWSRAPRRALESAALALVALELWTYGHGLVRTIPAGALFSPPRLARELPATTQRLFSAEPYGGDVPALVITAGNPRLQWARAPLERLSSRAGNLFGLSYALDRDFDRSLTRPAARALRLYEEIRRDPELEQRILAAWSVSHLVERKPANVLVEEALQLGPARAPSISPVRARPIPETLALYRFVAAAELFADPESAARAAVAARLPLDATEFLAADLSPPAAPEAPRAGVSSDVAVVASLPNFRNTRNTEETEELALRKLLAGRLDDARLRSVEDRGDRVRIAYVAAHPALLVAASTFDRRWQATSGGEELPLFETAAGYIAILVPPGEREVELRFRDPWVLLGAAISATTVLVALGLGLRRRRLARG